MNDKLNIITIDAMYIVVIFLVICLSVTLRYLLVLRSYLKSIMLAADSVSKGDFSVEIKKDMAGDLGKLVHNFNYMVKKIKNNFIDLEDKNVKLQSILKSTSNGIIAVDSRENVMLMNQKAKDMLGYGRDETEDKILDFIVSDKYMLSVIKNLISRRESSMQTIEEDGGHFLNIRVDPIVIEDEVDIAIGSIVNIEDITERKRLEMVRSDFVANVTHELKTPLTSISGFVETLKGYDDIRPEVRNRFLEIIEIETNRLRNLIDDILTLSFVESNETKKNPNLNDINLWEVYGEVCEIIAHLAEKKNIKIGSYFEKKDIVIPSNRDYIKQLFLNLVENAVKYTPEDGSVFVSVIERKNSIEIRVKDTGIGIPAQDIPRIFERFYRVEKARSRKIGGTGLGLAIVKHIVLSLNGTIKVESEINKGSEFIIEIPRLQR
ncbi:alkaline phosphatase synthesis sensor protein PhoR [Peptoclostridium acidaminophilum DSM 3953]|uniref:histidine kinase n=1 Tax=Peptoclostridium acidaminophilum DSM 3953 TaxID=1286171 RepID=W8T650_PEPAC|nr:HAMP domain-containing sensor histidine kinase [Peptoclostridium acidaminophilum]AHM56355.1 alkaline phosphatase synthesis sensor protein PhoR [Peptoclostridium acidaminophilum DSM 3953]